MSYYPRCREVSTKVSRDRTDITRDWLPLNKCLVSHESSEDTDVAITEQQNVASTQDESHLLDMLGLTEDDSKETCSRISHTCHKIAEDISHLFKVAAIIGKSIARDRYARAETASKEKFDDRYDQTWAQFRNYCNFLNNWLSCSIVVL